MSKMQQMLLALLACLCFTTVIAQVNINVEIRGLEQRLKDNVRLFLSIEQQKTHALMSEGRLHRLHKKAQLEITKALQPFGYYRPVIQTELTQIAPGQWQATYSVDPGPAIRVGEFNFKTSDEINQDTEFQQLIQKFSLHKGSVFNHREYENIKSSLAKLAAERGYFKARFNEHRIEIDLVAYEVRIHLNYEAGPRYRFGEVFLNQDVLEPDLIRRYIPFEKGAPYTLNEVLDLKQALNDSDYFQTVEVSPAPPPV
ncbi:MAG: outer membrane protein assembly factor, partial [Gammaproteobacteria bacterium]|nr:outer membrane protein assembly factor [Gammaproteobacteria bacterium]